MTQDQLSILLILAITVLMFVWGRWRYDMVLVGALITCVIVGHVAPEAAYAGFAHPAVVSVACVLILSKGLQATGAVDALAARVLPRNAGVGTGILALTTLVAVLSGFMNNVGALALAMPIGLQFARRKGVTPGTILMPLAFGSILGGTTTLIGTPPNLIVSGFRTEASGAPFGLFDFTPVGAVVALAGVVFIVLVGWRFVPKRRPEGVTQMSIGSYLTEVLVDASSPLIGQSIRDVEAALVGAEAQVLGVWRAGAEVGAHDPHTTVAADDHLVVEAEPRDLASVLPGTGLSIAASAHSNEPADTAALPIPGGNIIEIVVLHDSDLLGRTAGEIRFQERYSVNLLAISSRGRGEFRRLRLTRIEPGVVLVMHGTPEAIGALASSHGCVPLTARATHMPNRRLVLAAVLIMVAALAVAALGFMPASVSFAAAVVLYMAFDITPPRTAYAAVDWPVVVLLGAMIPVAGAMASTGAADVVAGVLQEHVARGSAVIGLIAIMAVTMLMTDTMNNAATAGRSASAASSSPPAIRPSSSVSSA